MSDVPSDLYLNILIYVPAKPLFRFRSVCKNWRSIIDDPVFGNSHVQLHRHLHSEEVDQLLIKRKPFGKLYSISMDALGFSGKLTKLIDATNISTLIHNGPSSHMFDLPQPPCDGLLLTSPDYFYNHGVWALWNPFNGESLVLPKCEIEGANPWITGLGYDPTTNDYKVVNHFVGNFPFGMQTLVYSLRSGKWKRIEDFHNSKTLYTQGVYLNGALYWVGYQHMHLCVLTFDLRIESYNVMPLPSPLFGTSRDSYCSLVLDVMGGSLLLSCYTREWRFDIWVMELCGGQSTWAKLVSLPSGYGGSPRLVAYCKSREKLLTNYDSNNFLWFDVIVGSGKKFNVQCMKREFSFQFFKPSLVRLKTSSHVDECVGADIRTQKTKMERDSLHLQLESGDFGD